ncbi:hypothetical protein [Paenibacillus odorifer]|uniref:hypothetical protein n=1 Tax=Paenibacillus odorifer TaxID=189426 RepID=UPI00096ED917|nr:hypothetical protein [Paenibacillus odorifer]OMD76588.1 hypothetical protein BSK50_14935 [Paenibacillus odorifer]
MSSVSGSTQIRIDSEVKLTLEEYRDTVRLKTHSDAIESLLTYHTGSERDKALEARNSESEKKRRGLEDITLGRDRKQILVLFKEKYGMPDLNSMFDVMLHHFETADKLSMDTVHLLLSLRK